MMDYSHLPVPPQRHPTAAARASLSARLGFEDHGDIQDWERHFSDAERIEEFLVTYVLGKLNEDEKFLLMDLILASAAFADNGVPSEETWREIELWLIDDFHIHHYSIWYWADIDEETGHPDNSFQISRRMQGLLQQDFARREAVRLKDVKPNERDFTTFWNSHFPGQKPACFALRESLRERWIRFHALPDSKRYAQTEDEWSILFDRHNQLGEHLLGEGAKCWLVVCRGIDPLPNEDNSHLDRFDFMHCFNMLMEELPGLEYELPVNVAETIWHSGSFDDLIREIAEGREAPIMFVSQVTHAIFGPYDGGVDLILPERESLPLFRLKYHEWLPANPAGL